MSWLKKKIAQHRRERNRRSLKDSTYQFLFDETKEEYVCFDCETTGLNPAKDRIVSLSAVRISGDRILTSQGINFLVAQTDSISEESIKVHQIRNQDLQQQQGSLLSEEEAVRRFLHFIRGATLVGYYLEFDVAMVNRILKQWLGIELPNPRIEVSELYYDLRAKEHLYGVYQPAVDLSFEEILKHLQLPNFGQHNAFNDALMTALIFVKLRKLQQTSF
ncbi:3'-5' exonuclease [Thiomicrorhabdus xiamenensis]|uniref:3'-5' exonuclease n=1 Tax=Thiomicrorhabdus xiamenensis TaxID=2739063 RepID=A0A7D4NLD8_9GAMM|nr:3'-5' exonuclease [Thiomicrorhabdus xiamenensis]QKI89094.1 3'-5' exonuclease [Thiomicrorhabdus xiamenensis]